MTSLKTSKHVESSRCRAVYNCALESNEYVCKIP